MTQMNDTDLGENLAENNLLPGSWPRETLGPAVRAGPLLAEVRLSVTLCVRLSGGQAREQAPEQVG